MPAVRRRSARPFFIGDSMLLPPPAELKANVLSGLTVSLALVPEAIALRPTSVR